MRTQQKDKMVASVIGNESVTTSFGTVSCWKLELKHETGPGLFHVWISDDEKRKVIKRRSEFQGNVIESILDKTF